MPRQSSLLVFVLLLAALSPVVAQDRVHETTVRAPGGIALATTVVRPQGVARGPAILIRSPYGRTIFPKLVHALADAGYTVVLQDVRGQGRSEGDFVPFVHERRDGLATLDWISVQPWSDGQVGMWGASYLGYAALILAGEGHPALKAVVNISGWGEVAPLTHPGGAAHLMLALPWMLTAQGDRRLAFNRVPWDEVFPRTPVVEIPSTLDAAHLVPAWRRAIVAVTDSSNARETSLVGRYERVTAPVLHITGWNDFAGRHTLRAYERIAAAGRAQQRLVVGPWRHDQIFTPSARVGDADFGAAAVLGDTAVHRLAVEWFDSHLRGRALPSSAPVRLFVMDCNVWRDADRFPPEGTMFEEWHIGPSVGTGDGRRLVRARPSRRPHVDRFLFDPANPVPTIGGANFHFFTTNLGVRDQRAMVERPDVLVYTSEPLTEPKDIAGPLRAIVYASTSATSADFTAKLVVVRPDGYARIVEEGIRRGPDDVRTKPGRVQRYTIDLGYTALHVPAGHRLRLEISSSNFPKYTRNPSTGEVAEIATEFRTAEQRVRVSRRHPTRVILPVWRAGSSEARRQLGLADESPSAVWLCSSGS